LATRTRAQTDQPAAEGWFLDESEWPLVEKDPVLVTAYMLELVTVHC
jgi:hypothetical protein